MERRERGFPPDREGIQAEMWGLLREPMPNRRWLSARQHKIWRPPTDVYETDSYLVVKVEIAGIEAEDLALSLESKTLTIAGVRHDPAAKLAYQQMEILYGAFETVVQLPWAIEEEGIEASYSGGFLSVLLPKARPRQVPVVSAKD
jgi:HSP20 family protein